MTRTALFLSPHLDDVVFSCGGLAALLHDQGWRTVLATAFTATVLPATGFALACQLDKGLSADVDYMALRRAEDEAAAAILGFTKVLHLGLPEAPHRGYDTAQALFGSIRKDDEVSTVLAGKLTDLAEEFAPDVVLAPQGLGGHVDHLQMVRAILQTTHTATGWFRDTPYALRHRGAPAPAHAAGLADMRLRIDAGLDRKLRAVIAYTSQIGFQFGGTEHAKATLTDFARTEAADDGYAERMALTGAAVALLRRNIPMQAVHSTRE